MHAILAINSLLQYAFAIGLALLLMAWVFEGKIFQR